jgi:hypothetical protein
MIIDREMFVRYIGGELISRDENDFFVANEVECESAIKSAENGEIVFLSVEGRPVSKIVDNEEVPTTIEEYQDYQKKEWEK